MENQNTNKGKSTKILLVTALVVAAVVLVIVVGRFYPPVSQDQAAGTIGAVKKYRVQQISDKDVVLAGQEAEQAQAPSAALLNDAAKLQNIGARLVDVASRLRNAQLEKATNLANLETEIDNLSNSMAGLSADLQNRALVNMRAWAEDASKLLAGNAMGVNAEELALLQARIANITSQMAKLSARLGSADHENLASQLAAINSELEQRRKRANAGVDDMSAQMEANAARLAASAPLEHKYLANMKEQLSECASKLKLSAQFSTDLLEARRLFKRSISREFEELANAQQELANRKKRARGGSESDIAELASRLSNLGMRLANQSSEIEQETMQNVKSVLFAMSTEQNTLENLSSALELSARRLRDRAAELGEGEATEMQARLGAMDQELASRINLLARKALGNMQLQMKFINSSLENNQAQTEAQARYWSNCITELNVRLENRRDLMEKQTMDAAGARVANMRERLANKEVLGIKK
jgi:hypothetical protein